jgi:hypothetical protein
MRKVLWISGLVILFVSCANDGGTAGTGKSDSDTVAAPNTTNYGAAGSGGVGAGFGPGERPGVDTNLPASAVTDTARTGGNR